MRQFETESLMESNIFRTIRLQVTEGSGKERKERKKKEKPRMDTK